jgi:hypothetical protein
MESETLVMRSCHKDMYAEKVQYWIISIQNWVICFYIFSLIGIALT